MPSLKKLSKQMPELLAGTRSGVPEIPDQPSILRAYTENGKVYTVTQNGIHTLKLRLYMLEAQLDRAHFVRISNTKIITLKQVKRFDLSLSGAICVTMADGAVAYVSRRYTSKIKQPLKICGEQYE